MLPEAVSYYSSAIVFKPYWTILRGSTTGRICHCFHSWPKLSRVLATMLKFIDTAHHGWFKKTSNKPTNLTSNLIIDEPLLNIYQLSVDKIERAEMFLFRIAQYFDFTDEVLALYTAKKLVKSSRLRKLRPFWDQEDSIIRMFGRSPSSRLIILPKAKNLTGQKLKQASKTSTGSSSLLEPQALQVL